MLLDDLIVWYLFLGGAGSGAYLVWFIHDLTLSRTDALFSHAQRRYSTRVLAISLTLVAAGSLCLLADLSVPTKAHLLFTKPSLSLISVGAISLAVLLPLLAAITIGTANLTRHSKIRSQALSVAKVVAALLSVVTMMYTGLLLHSMAAVPFWRTPALPLLFAASSCSSGLGVSMLVIASLLRNSPQLLPLLRNIMHCDMAVIACEAASGLLAFLTLRGNTVAALSLEALLTGEYALLFWIGAAGTGLLLPLLAEALTAKRRPRSMIPYAMTGSCTLAGALILRYCIVAAGIHLSQFAGIGL